MRIGNDKVIIENCILSWDGLRNPDVTTKNDGSGTITKHNVSVLVPGNSPVIAELTEIANKQLNEGIFRGTLPPNGNWPLDKQADPAKFGSQYAGYVIIGAGTQRGVPTILDANSAELSIMSCGQQLYPGCIVSILVHAYDYNNVQKGVSFGLDGIQIVDPSAPPLPVGGGMSAGEVANAFGGGGAPAPAPGTAPPAPPAAPATNFTRMTELAGGATYESFIAAGWTDETLVANGYMLPS